MLCAGGKNVWKALQSGYAQATRGQAERLAHVITQHNIKVTSCSLFGYPLMVPALDCLIHTSSSSCTSLELIEVEVSTVSWT